MHDFDDRPPILPLKEQRKRERMQKLALRARAAWEQKREGKGDAPARKKVTAPRRDPCVCKRAFRGRRHDGRIRR